DLSRRPELRRQGQRARAVLRRARDDEHRAGAHRAHQRRRGAALLLPPARRRLRLCNDLRRAARRPAERRPQRGHAQAQRRARGPDSAFPRPVLVDPQALQEPTRAAAQPLRRRSSGVLTAMPEPAAAADDLSLARFWAPRYWPTWLVLLAMHATARLPFRWAL